MVSGVATNRKAMMHSDQRRTRESKADAGCGPNGSGRGIDGCRSHAALPFGVSFASEGIRARFRGPVREPRWSAKRIVERMVTAVVVAAFVSGCSTKGIRAAGSVGGNAASAGKGMRPSVFEVSIGGFFGASYRVELQSDGTLLYRHNPKTLISEPGTRTRRVRVGDDQWREFRRVMDEVNVWVWRKEYIDPNVADGTQWSLRLEYADASVVSRGSNAFPEQQAFERFRAAVEMLLGGREFK